MVKLNAKWGSLLGFSLEKKNYNGKETKRPTVVEKLEKREKEILHWQRKL